MLVTFLAAVFVLGVLIFVHELGHFLAAKAVGIRVEKFSLGFPPKLIGKKIGETEYIISLIPFGGYVKMAGEEEIPEENSAQEVHPWEFRAKSVPKRTLVVLGGPLMNLLLALMVIWILTWSQGVGTISSTKIGGFGSQSPLKLAGLAIGDRIIEINGVEVREWNDVYKRLDRLKGETLRIKVERENQVEEFQIKPLRMSVDSLLWPFWEARIREVKPNSPAERAGLKKGDLITSVEGKKIEQWEDLEEIIHKNPGRELRVSWIRDGKIFWAEIRPDTGEVLNQAGKPENVGMIGIIGHYLELKKLSLLGSFGYSLSWAVNLTWEIINFIKELILGQISPKFIGGPVFIIQVAGQTARYGLANLIFLLAIISLNLALVNVLPIPPLDGGQFTFLLWETVRGRAPTPNQKLIFQRIGFFILVGLMIFVTINDISRIIK
jgi:regulator of sigma E protease